MSAEIIKFASRARVDEAWGCYVEMARKLAAEPSLLSDRAFHEEMTRRHDKWRKLFLIMEPEDHA